MDIQSKEVIDKISRDLKVQPSLEIPRELTKTIQLNYNVNPERDVFVKPGSALDSASSTAYTTPTGKDTYLLGFNVTLTKDAVNDGTSSSIRATVVGQAVGAIFRIAYTPSTAGQFTETVFFPIPLKLERGTSLVLTNGTATASIDFFANFYLYEVDPQ